MMPGQMMPTTGIEQLGDFQNDMNSRSGLDRLRAMQTLGLMSLANDTYMEEETEQNAMMNPEQPMMQQGLSGLPVVEAGFGGFLKSVFKAVTRPIKAVVKGVSKFAKSKIGKMIVPAALAFAAPWALGLSFSASPFLYSAAAGLGSGLGSLISGAKPGDALKSALIGGLSTYAGGSLFNKFGGAGSTVKPMTGASTKVFGQNVATGATKALGTGGGQTFGSLGTMGTGAGTVGSQAATAATAIPSALTGSPLAVQAAQQAATNTALTNVGLAPTAPTGPFSSTVFTGGGSAVAPSAAVQPGAQSIFSGDTSAQAFKNLPKQLVQYGKEALTKPETYGAIARDMAPSPFDQPALSPEDELEGYGFTRTPNSLGLQEAYYVNPDTGQEMSITDAMAYMRSKSQGITGAQRRDQATQVGGFGNLAPQLKYRPTGLATNTPYPFMNKDGGAVIPQQDGSEILRSSGGLMGYAYGGQLPEFSGQVPGEGHGMEDNISFPITERQGGGEVQIAEGRLSPDEYVVDANTMSLLGNGSPDAGAKIMDKTVRDVRMAATGQREQQKEINGLQALSRMKRNI
tara:strand:+ start:1625 stop:3340 length:1716 start_codon:yes stop_codon:yes gene_type:complete